MNKLLKLVCLSALAVLGLEAFAVEVAPEQARTAVRNWIRRNPCAMTARFATVEGEARPFARGGRTLFHVVQLEGGGFVVASGDTRVAPIVAFSGGGEFSQDERNPLFAMLEKDMSARLDSLAADSGVAAPKRQVSASAALPSAQAARPKTDNERAWDELLAASTVQAGVQTHATRPKSSLQMSQLEEVRVEPLVKTEWDQTTWGRGKTNLDTYNRFTPNNYPCGCVATAGAQIMKYWEYPKTSVTAKTCDCYVDGVGRSLKMKGGTYDWSSMPLKYASAPGITAAQREAIGKLTYDVGVASRMIYAPKVSLALGSLCAMALRETFGYKSANSFFPGAAIGKGVNVACRDAILGSIDAGMPTFIGIQGSGNTGHEVVVDGYGFAKSRLYVHLNCGWSGIDDVWYDLFNEYLTSNKYSIIQEVGYNVHPTESGDVISGRVLDRGGRAVDGASVTMSNGSTARTVKTNAKGIYAFRVSSAGEYSVSAKAGDAKSKAEVVQMQRMSQNAEIGEYSLSGARVYNYGCTANKWGVDLVLESESDVVEPLEQVSAPVFSPSASSFTSSSLSVTLSCSTAGATIYYTVNGATPTTSSARYTGAVPISSTTTFKAIAVKSGMANSDVASKTYTKQAKQTITAAQGMDWSGAVAVSSSSNVYGWDEITHDGIDSAVLAASKTAATASITVYGPGTLSFWWAADSYSIFDNLEYYVDGSKKGRKDGVNWRKVSVPVTSGSHVVKWSLDSGFSAFVTSSAKGFLDEVSFVPFSGGSCTVTFLANGADGGSPEKSSVSAQFADELKAPGCGTLYRDGYAFLGWATSASAQSPEYYEGATMAVAAQDMKLYAVWKPCITLLAEIPREGGTRAIPLDKCYGSSYFVQTDTPEWAGNFKLKVDTSTVVCGSGWASFGFAPNSDVTVVVSAEENDTAEERAFNIDLNALTYPFVIRCHVVQKADVTSTVARQLVIEAENGGDFFSGTSVVGASTEKFVARIVRRNSAVDDVHADWSIMRGGEYASVSDGVLTTKDVKTKQAVVVRASYVESGTRYTAEREILVEPKDGAPAVCTITFYANGGAGDMANQTVSAGVAAKLSKCTFTKAGHSFVHWSGSDGKTYLDQESVTISGDLALTAQWEADADHVWTIEDGVLVSADLAGLAEITIPSSVSEIADGVFSEQGGLRSVTIPSSVVRIGESAFDSCPDLEEVVLAEGLREIGSFAFYGCRALNLVKFPESLEKIGRMAFCESGLLRADIPAKTSSIGVDAFGACPDLWMMTVADGNPKYRVASGGLALVDVSSSTLVQVSAYADGDFRIPDGIAEIGPFAFDAADGITSVTIPASVGYIGREPFYFCTKLGAVYFGGNAPDCYDEQFERLSATVYVLQSSTGWGVSIPGTWKGLPIRYAGNCRVSFDANGGTGSMTPQDFSPGAAQRLKACAFSQSGCAFAGWATSAPGRVEYNDGQSISIMSDTTLYATWQVLAPTGFSASTDRSDGVFLKWNSVGVADATYYISRSEDDDYLSSELVKWTYDTSFLDATAQQGVRYRYWIFAGRTILDMSDVVGPVAGVRQKKASGPGTVSVASAREVQAGETLRVTLRRSGGSTGRIAVKYKTQTSTGVCGADFDYVKDVLVWEDGESGDKTIEVPTHYIAYTAYPLMLRVKLSTLTQGAYLGCVTPALAESKVYFDIVDNWNPGEIVATAPNPLEVKAGSRLRMTLSRRNGSDGRIAVKYKTQTSTGICGVNGSADFDYVKDILVWESGDSSDRVIEIPTYAKPARPYPLMLRVKLAPLATGANLGNLVPVLSPAKVYVTIKK